MLGMLMLYYVLVIWKFEKMLTGHLGLIKNYKNLLLKKRTGLAHNIIFGSYIYWISFVQVWKNRKRLTFFILFYGFIKAFVGCF